MVTFAWRSRPLWQRALAGGAALFLAAFVWLFVDLVSSIPGKDELRAFRWMPRATVLFDAKDEEVFTIAKEHRIEIPLSDMSPALVNAVVAIEDKRFYDHDGFDLIRIAGSALAVIQAGEAVQGGSTITQQLARQSVGREKTLRRKLKEMLFAMQLERHFSKDEILELYLNKVYFGDGLYGVEAAARGYFAKHASDLTLAEAALLAGLLKAPSSYAPTGNPGKAEARQGVVLKAMLDNESISQEQYDHAARTVVEVYDGLRAAEPHGRYFKDEIRRQLVERFGADRVNEGGLNVYTTFDFAMQRAAEAAVEKSLQELDARLPAKQRDGPPLQAALIAIDPRNGHVRALIGGRSFRESSYNRAMQSKRQPGSAFKPFVYAAAVEAGFNPDDTLDGLDEPVQLAHTAWTPDDEHVEHEELTLREGLRLSSNRAAVRLLEEVGLQPTIESAERFGFEDLPVVPSIALGAGEVTLSSLTSAYAAFANGGQVSAPVFIRRVEDSGGVVLFEATGQPRRAIRAITAYLMADMLRGVIDGGTGYGARRFGFALPAGGKTGTTNDYRDVWFVGFTPSVVSGVWIGYDQPRTIRREGYASELAVPMWARFMKEATRGHKAEWLLRPRDADASARFAKIERPKKRSFWSKLFGLDDDDR